MAEKYIVWQNRSGIVRIPLSNIIYIYHEDKMSVVVTRRAVYRHKISLKELAGHLDGRFYRCHRSYIINMEKIEGLDHYTIFMVNGDEITLCEKVFQKTRRYYQEYLCRNKLLALFSSEC